MIVSPDSNLDDLLSEEAAAKKFGRSAAWLASLRRAAARRGDRSFPAFRVGRAYFYFGAQLAAWVQKQKPSTLPPQDSPPIN